LADTEGGDLSKLALALAERPSLHLEIRGRADPGVDEPGLRIARVDQAVKLAAFDSLSRRKRTEVGDPSAIVLDSEERLTQLERLYRTQTGGRVGDLIPAVVGSAGSDEDRRRALSEAAVAALAAQVEINPADLRALARDRAASVRTALLETELIEADRVFLVEVEVGPVGSESTVPTQLSLRAD
jgi:hypothetical protein